MKLVSYAAVLCVVKQLLLPLCGEERCVTTKRTAAYETTMKCTRLQNVHSHCSFKFFFCFSMFSSSSKFLKVYFSFLVRERGLWCFFYSCKGLCTESITYFLDPDEESLSDCDGSLTPNSFSCSSLIKEKPNM